MVAGTQWVRGVERFGSGFALEGPFGSVLDRVVVVEERVLVGVDVPGGGPGHLGQQRPVGEGVVEVAELAVEDVGVGVVALEPLEQVGVPRLPQRGDRVLHTVGVEVPDDQEVLVAAARRVGGQVVRERLGGVGAGLVAVGLAVAEVGVTVLGT